MRKFTLKEYNDINDFTYKSSNESVDTRQYNSCVSAYDDSSISLSDMKNKLRYIEADFYNFHKKNHLNFNGQKMLSIVSIICFLFIFLLIAIIATKPEWFSRVIGLHFSFNSTWIIVPAAIIGLIMQIITNRKKKDYTADYNQRILKPVLESCYPGCTVRNNEKLANNPLYFPVKNEFDLLYESTLYITGRYHNTEFEVSNVTLYYDSEVPNLYGTLIMIKLPCPVKNRIKIIYRKRLTLRFTTKKNEVKLPDLENKNIIIYADDPYNLPDFFNARYINKLTMIFPEGSLYKIIINENHAFITINDIFMFAIDTKQRFSLDRAIDKIGNDMNIVQRLIELNN